MKRRASQLIATILILIVGFISFGLLISTLLDIQASTPEANNQTSPCQDKIILPSSSVTTFNSFALDRSQALFVHFHLVNLSRLAHSKDILDPVNLVWVESVSAPFLSLDLGFNVYSLTTLQGKVHHMSVSVEFISYEGLNNITDRCLTSILAAAFLKNVSQGRGALCYAVKTGKSDVAVKYRCCKTEINTQQITCDVPASISPEMIGIFSTIIVLGIIVFLCFPVITIHIPDEDDSSQTISANTQIHNPLYRIVATVVQIMRRYSATYYVVDLVRKLLIGSLLLPMLFYIDLVLTLYTAKHDIPKMFNDAVRNDWRDSKLNSVICSAVLYNVVVLLISIVPRAEKIDFSKAPNDYQEKASRMILEAASQDECDWMKPYLLAKEYWLMAFEMCFDIKSLWFALLLWVVLLVDTIPIFICYGVYISPVCQKISLLICHADVFFLWLKWYFEKISKALKRMPIILCAFRVSVTVLTVVIGVGILESFLAISYLIIIPKSLLLISRLISYFIMGIVASKDDFLPLIALFSLFLFYIWNCLSSVSNGYKDLLNQTFDACKEYQEKENQQVITVDRKGTPRIARLSDIFQKVVNEMQPFSKTYTVMCVKIIIIASFLSLTYFSILVFGKTSLNSVTKTLAVSLAGLIPKVVELFRSSNNKKLIDKENTYRVREVVFAFIDSEWRQSQENCSTEISQAESSRNCPDNTDGDGNSRLLSVNSDSSSETTPLLQSQRRNRDPGDVVST